MSFATRFVYVGVGGSGLKIGKSLEKLLREEICGPDGRRLIRKNGSFALLGHMELPSFIQTLYIDFAEQDLVSLQNDTLPQAAETTLKTATFVRALSTAGHSSADVTDLLRGSSSATKTVSDWLPPRQSEWGGEPTFAPLSTGAGQYPTIGRAALFAYMERFGAEALMRDLRRPFERIVGSIGQLEEFAGTTTASRNVVIMVGCSLSGGTGGGLFLDICKLISHVAADQLGDTPFTVVPLVLLPSAFDNALAPSKRKNAKLNAIRALADLGHLIDSQNAPQSGTDIVVQEYPGGEGGDGTLQVVLPAAAIKTAFLFNRPTDVPTDGALSERVAWFAANLVRQPSVSKVSTGSLGSGRTMTLLDRMVNNAGLLQERHPTFIGRRPFASAASIAIRDGREEIVQIVAEDLLREFLEARANSSDDQLKGWAAGFEEAMGLRPPQLAPIDPNYRTKALQPPVVTEEGVRAAFQTYQTALNQVMPPTGQKQNVLSEILSAGADAALEKATGLADPTGQWIDAVLRVGKENPDASERDLDFVSILLAVKEAAGTWSSGQLVAGRRNAVPAPESSKLMSGGRRGFLRRAAQPRMNPGAVAAARANESFRVDDTWRTYLANSRGNPVKFRGAAGDLRDRVARMERSLTEWQEIAKPTTRDARLHSVRERYAFAQDYGTMRSAALRQTAANLGTSDSSAISIVRTILSRFQQDLVEAWRKDDNLDPTTLPHRLVDKIREELSRAFDDPEVYVGLPQILQRWAEEDGARPDLEVRQFRTKMLSSITDSLVPPSLDRDIEPMVTIAYPGEQHDGVEAKLREALATHPSFAAYMRQSAPTFVPNAGGGAVVVSVSLIGQGLVDIEDGAEALNSWIESAFRPAPTDRLAWRQRTGYRDPIDFIDETARAELLQRLLAAAWNGQLTAKELAATERRVDGEPAGKFESLTLRFGADDAPSLTIPLGDMPFAHHLAPLVDAFLREISRRYAMDSDVVSEILRELSKVIPNGFVERAQPTLETLQQRSLFLDLVPGLGDGSAGIEELTALKRVRKEAEAASRTGDQKRVRQIDEYISFWAQGINQALALSFGTLGYGSLAEACQEAVQILRSASPRS